MRFTPGYIVGFTAVVCVVCSVAVATAADLLRARIEVNERWDRQIAILSALDLPPIEPGETERRRPWGEEVDTLYASRVGVAVIDPAGNRLPDKTIDDVVAEEAAAEAEGREPALLAVYLRKDGDGVGAVALPVSGTGLWGPISGFIALSPNGETVSGATFFAPKETPGLGYEITATPFTSQFVGKKVFDGADIRTVRVVKGKAADVCPTDLDHCVDGVSGATLTSDGVDAMIAEGLERYTPFLKQIHGGTR